MLTDKKEIHKVMKDIHEYFQKMDGNYNQEELSQMTSLAKTVGISLKFSIEENDDDEKYVKGVDINVNNTDEVKYSELWCEIVTEWEEKHVEELKDLIANYCEENNLSLFKVTLKFKKTNLMIMDLNIDEHMSQRKAKKLIGDIFEETTNDKS